MLTTINAFIRDTPLKNFKVGSPEYFSAQKRVILQRYSLKYCYDFWYSKMLSDAASVKNPGILLELGSGGGYLKDIKPEVVTSDVIDGIADKVIDGRELPFDNKSIKALFLTHVLHHIPEVRRFFREAERTLVDSGVISLIEVSHTPFARYFFSNHHPEPYTDNSKDWDFSQTDTMMDSNQALSWMIFFRDQEKFQKEFPNLVVEQVNYLPWLSYLAAGGVTGPCMIPGFLGRIPPIFDRLLSPLSPLFALHWHIRIRKRES